MKFKNLSKMKILTDKEMTSVLGGDCKSCSQSCKKACSQGGKSGGTVDMDVDVDLGK